MAARLSPAMARAAVAAVAMFGLLALFEVFHAETSASPGQLTNEIAGRPQVATEPTENESELIEFVLDLLDHGANSPDTAHAVVASSLLAEAEARLREPHNDAVIQVSMLSGLADIHFRQGNYQRSRELLERSVALASDVYGDDSLPYVRARVSLARVMGHSGHPEAASILYADALTRIGQFPDSENDLATILDGLGLIALKKGNFGAAEQHLAGALEVAQHRGEAATATAEIQEHLAILYRETKRYDEALAELQLAWQIRRQTEEPRAHAAGFNLATQADVLLYLDRPGEAAELARQAVQSFEALPNHQLGRAVAQVALARALLQLDQLETASENLLESIEVLKQQEPARAMMHLASATNVLGDLEDRLGERQKAEYYYRLSIAGFEKLLGRSHPRTQAALSRFREYAALN